MTMDCSKGAPKDDAGKPQLSMIPYEALVQVARVFEFGSMKYQRDSWRKGIAEQRLIDAALRHLHKFADGAYEDEESGLPHAAHVITNMCMILEFRKKGTICGD